MKKHLAVFIAITMPLFLCSQGFAKTIKTEEWETQNGARVIFYYAPEVPMLDINIAFAAGSAYDGVQFGLSELTKNLLDQGNGGMDAGALADKFAEVGAQYGGGSTKDMMVLTLRTLTESHALKQATEMFALLINHPDFPEDAFLREKDQQLLSIQQRNESPDTVAQDAFDQALYGLHPYAHPIHGNENTVKDLKIDDVRRFYKQYLVGRNAVIVLAGSIDSTSAHQLAERITHDLPQGQAASPTPAATPLNGASNIEVQHTALQTALRLGQLGISHQNKDYFPLQVGNFILGGGTMGSRLSQELREKRGLTYGVTSTFSSMPGIGPFIISLSTKHNQAKTALDITQKALALFINTGPDEQELIAAKQYLTGSFPISLEGNRNMANMLLRLAFYHLPTDFLNTYIERINAVSTRDIQQAFQHQINPNKLLHITVGRS